MKKRLLRIGLALSALVVMPAAVAQTQFVHPGITHKLSDLDRMKCMVDAQIDPWYSSYQEMAADSKASYDYVVRGDASFTELGRDSGVNYGAWNSDIRAAYYNAIRWYVTGDSRHAEKAVEIFNAWKNLTSVTSGGTDALSGGVAYIMIEAAEIIRSTYSGWSASDIQDFSDMLVYPGYSTTSAPSSGDTSFYWMAYQGDPGRHGNQGLSGWRTVMAMGIFLDNEIMYDRALRHIKGLPHRPDDLPYPSGPRTRGSLISSTEFVDSYSTSPGSAVEDYGYNGVMTHYIWENGQCQESSRDMQHTFFGIGLICSMAEMAWNQGEDLYSHEDDRLLLGLEYNMRYNVSDLQSFPDQPSPWVPTVASGEFVQRDDRTLRWFSKAISDNGIGGFSGVRPVFEIPVAHYLGRGFKTEEEAKWTLRARDKAIELSGYEVAGHSNDAIGWGGLTARRPDFCYGDPIRGFSSGLPLFAMNDLPGTIEAENFDHFAVNGEGHTYHDKSVSNSGGEYRPSEAVDIAICSEGGHALTSLEADEWLSYTVAVPSTGLYDISVRYAASQTGGKIQFSFGGVDASTEVPVPFGGADSTGLTDWKSLTVASGVTLSKGVQSMKVRIAGVSEAFQLNNISIERAAGLLAGHWTFDDGAGAVAVDSSGHGYDGTNVDASWVGGIDNGALDFDGTSSQVAIPASAFSTVNDQITVAMWVFGSAEQPANNSAFYAVSGNQRVLNIHLPWNDSNVYWDAGNESGYDRINKLAVDSEFKSDWNHWAFTKDATTGTMKIFLNGELWHSGTGKTKTMTGITAATIGSQISGVHYDGSMDDVRLYDVALSDQEIASLYYQYPVFAVDGLVANATGETQVDLTWDGATGATAYNLKRSLTSGGPYTLIAGGVTTTSFVDTGLSAGVEYHYVVCAVYGGTESGASLEASAMPSAPTGTSPVIATTSLPNGTVGVPYQQVLVATGGEGLLSWTLLSGELPPGMALSSDGVLSGTSSASGTSTFTVRVADEDGDQDTQELNLGLYTPGGGPPEKFGVRVGGLAVSDFQDPNVPANTIDGDLGSRWSAQGNGQWIRYDLRSLKNVHSLEIAWLSGSSRTANFDVQVSEDDATWTSVTGGTVQSSGTTTELETVDVTDTLARYVRIVGFGNSANDWNSITEVEIWGTTPPPPGVPTDLTSTPGNGQVSLSWSVSSGATVHHLKRSTNSDSGFVTIASVAGGGFIDTTVANGTTYYYVISAESGSGESADSAFVEVKPYASIAPEELVGPAMTRSGNRLDFRVESVLGRIYQLERSETLAADDWEPVGVPIIGNGSALILSDPEAFLVPKCFYRVEIEP